MLRIAYLFALLACLLGLAAHRAKGPVPAERNAAVNSSANPLPWIEPAAAAAADTSAPIHLLMLNYVAYDSFYAQKVGRFVRQQLPACTLTEFWDGSADDLAAALHGQDAVVIAYPSTGDAATLRAYGKVLAQYVRGGGAVLFTGTHQFDVLQEFGLLELDFGYYCQGEDLHSLHPEHPVLAGTPADFRLANYAYPLDVSDPNFVVLADVRGYPVLGYKLLGAGKILYLGLEYYYNEATATRILVNAVRWAVPARPERAAAAEASAESAPRVVRRTEEVLYAGRTAKPEQLDLKIYPNPYYAKATLDLELTKSSPVALDMTDETGRVVAVLLPQRTLSAGAYRFELPSVPPGVYLVHCQVDGRSTVKKVVKAEAQ